MSWNKLLQLIFATSVVGAVLMFGAKYKLLAPSQESSGQRAEDAATIKDLERQLEESQRGRENDKAASDAEMARRVSSVEAELERRDAETNQLRSTVQELMQRRPEVVDRSTQTIEPPETSARTRPLPGVVRVGGTYEDVLRVYGKPVGIHGDSLRETWYYDSQKKKAIIFRRGKVRYFVNMN
jgi:hypothetical protein